MTWSWSCSICSRSGEVEPPCVVYFHRCIEPYRESRHVSLYGLSTDLESHRQRLWREHRAKFEGDRE